MPGYFSWQNPALLRWLWLLPPLAALVWFAVVRREWTLRTFLGARYVPADWRWHRRRRLLKGALVVGAIGLMIVAMARPRLGSEVQKVKRVGADVVFVIDTSDSMLAQDVSPSRLEAAKEAALALAGRLEGDRIGVVVFAGSAYMYSPLTLDHDAVSMFVSSIERGSAPAPGTALDGAVGSAVRLLSKAEAKYRAIVLFTDGEDQEENDRVPSLQKAHSEGIRVHVVGLGDTQGEPIHLPAEEAATPDANSPEGMLDQLFGTAKPSQTSSAFKRDAEGKVVMTKLNEKLLARIAKEGDGVFVRSSASGTNVDRIYQAIGGMEGAVAGTYQFTQYAERFQWPLGIALVLLILEMLISHAPANGGGQGNGTSKPSE